MPRFSVIIACVSGLPSIGECLAALEKSRARSDVEIVVIDRTGDETSAFIEERFPGVKLIRVAEKVGIPEMRAIGMREAVGDFLVVTEDHCLASENWFDEIGRAHSAGYPVAGGAVENASTKRQVDWAAFLCEYSSFISPVPDGEVEFLAGNNVSYERSVIAMLDDALLKNFWEYFLQAELKKRNVKFVSSPNITIDHKKEFGFLYFLGQRFHYSRSFAAMRRRRTDVPRQLLYLAYTPFVPIHQSWRIFRNVMSKKRHRKELLLSFPILAMFLLSYAAGELAGQLLGAGKSLSKVE